MKTRVIKCILALLFIFAAMPMMAQDYMEIHFKNGEYKKLFLREVGEIGTKQYDSDGAIYSDYRYLHINTSLGELVYDINDIEDVSFSKFNEEEVKETVNSVMSTTVPILNDCETLAEAEQKIELIKEAEGVIDAWSDGHQLFVEMEDRGTISFHYSHDNNENQSNSKENIIRQIKKYLPQTNSTITANPRSLRVVIANQAHNDESRGYVLDIVNELQRQYLNSNVQLDYVPNPTIDFFKSKMFDYHMVFLITHGGYDAKTNTHSLATSNEFGMIPKTSEKAPDYPQIMVDNLNALQKKYHASNQQIQGSFFEETRNGEKYWVCYAILMESFFDNNSVATGNFSSDKSIMFNVACMSLEGNDNLANKIRNRGLGVYIGYTGSNSIGQHGGKSFLTSMLEGMSLQKAYDDIPEKYCYEWDTNGNVQKFTEIKMIPESGGSLGSLFLTPVYTEQVEQSEVNQQFVQDNRISVKGIVTLADNANEKVSCGFEYGETENNMSQNIIGEIMPMSLSSTKGNRMFSAMLTGLTPGNTYFYRAYTYDGMNYNYGETCSFTIEATKKLIKVEPTEIDFGEVEVGSSKSAIFTVSNVGTASLTVTVASGLDEGDDCVLPGSGQQFTLAVGQSKTFTVTYSPTSENSGFNAIVRILSDAENDTQIVTVSGHSYKAADIPSHTSCPDNNHPHLIDLGLPSGTKWACCNVGAQKPEDYGGYYAWGETEEKDYYSSDNYLDGKGKSYFIGNDIAGTDYDVAHVKWGGSWVMPTLNQMKELLNNCTSEWTTENGVNGRRFTGPNGASIFLPAAGRRWSDDLDGAGSYGDFWSSTLFKTATYGAYVLYFRSTSAGYDWCRRYDGQSVRPVRKN